MLCKVRLKWLDPHPVWTDPDPDINQWNFIFLMLNLITNLLIRNSNCKINLSVNNIWKTLIFNWHNIQHCLYCTVFIYSIFFIIYLPFWPSFGKLTWNVVNITKIPNGFFSARPPLAHPDKNFKLYGGKDDIVSQANMYAAFG